MSKIKTRRPGSLELRNRDSIPNIKIKKWFGSMVGYGKIVKQRLPNSDFKRIFLEG